MPSRRAVHWASDKRIHAFGSIVCVFRCSRKARFSFREVVLTRDQKRLLREKASQSRSPRGNTYLHIEAFRLRRNAFCCASAQEARMMRLIDRRIYARRA